MSKVKVVSSTSQPFNYIHTQFIKNWLLAESRGELEISLVNRWMADLGYISNGWRTGKSTIVVYHRESNECMLFEV